MKGKFILSVFFAMAGCSLSYAQDTTDAQAAAAAAAAAISQAPEVKTPEPKPRYWSNSVMTQLNFIQNCYSSWAKGGYNNVSFSAYIDANANYKKDNISWANRLQLDYGFLYSEDKPIMQKNKDRMLFESTFGYKATEHLNYSAKFTFLNQFSNGYVYATPATEEGEEPSKQDWKDARLLKSGFFSPATVTLGLGIDWNPNNWLTVNFAPITGGFTIVTKEALRPTYSMKLKHLSDEEQADYDYLYSQTYDNTVAKGEAIGKYYKAARFEFGAQLTASAKLKINDNFEADTQLILFSNYLDDPQNIRINWDNRFSWKVAKYFSLNITTNLIYDDTVLIVEDWDMDEYPNGKQRVQFMEALQFGFTYTFASKK
jgi:hypothetical protein